MLSQRRRRLSVLSSACQHVATLQFVSGAETDKFRAFSRPHPCFPRPRWDWLRLRVCPWKACPPKQAYVYSFDSVFLQPALCRFAYRKAFPWKQVEVDLVDTGHHCFSVVAQATPQDSCKASPRLCSSIFEWKTWIEELKLFSSKCWVKGGEGWACWVQRANMWPHCSLSAVQRQTNSEPFPDLILVFHAQGEIDWDCGFALGKPARQNRHMYTPLTVFFCNLLYVGLPVGKPSRGNR